MPLKASETSYYVRDLKQAISFYVDKLGGKLIREFDWGFALIDVTGKKDYIGLFNVAYAENELGQGEVYPRPRLVLQADDLDEELSRLQAAGIKVGPVSGTKGQARAFNFYDLDDNPFFVWEDPTMPFPAPAPE